MLAPELSEMMNVLDSTIAEDRNPRVWRTQYVIRVF
jgi:hypothetical protein